MVAIVVWVGRVEFGDEVESQRQSCKSVESFDIMDAGSLRTASLTRTVVNENVA